MERRGIASSGPSTIDFLIAVLHNACRRLTFR
jgi:hypothetical protein